MTSTVMEDGFRNGFNWGILQCHQGGHGPSIPAPACPSTTHPPTMGSSPAAGHSASAVSNMILSVAALCFQANPEHHIVGLGTNRLLRQQVVWV